MSSTESLLHYAHVVGCHTPGEDVAEQSACAPCWLWRYLLSWREAKEVSNEQLSAAASQLQHLCE